ncbi:hint module [Ostertagia ostertagi]
MWWLLVVLPAAVALNYRCQNDQVLVVQSFGNDTIRMHCQQLDMCGYQQLRCDYDESQPQCGGLMNFVAHVVQTSATSPVEHTCCNLFNPRAPHTIPTHVGNDCFIYELPDGSSHPKQPDSHDDTPYTVLKSASEIPEHIDGMSGYRLRLYLLKNKAPPTLLVKGIERRLVLRSSQVNGRQSAGAVGRVPRGPHGHAACGEMSAMVRGVNESKKFTTTGSTSGPATEGGPQHIHVHVNASGNNNNVIDSGRGASEPGHINITVHTGQFGGGGGDAFNSKQGGLPNAEGSSTGSGREVKTAIAAVEVDAGGTEKEVIILIPGVYRRVRILATLTAKRAPGHKIGMGKPDDADGDDGSGDSGEREDGEESEENTAKKESMEHGTEKAMKVMAILEDNGRGDGGAGKLGKDRLKGKVTGKGKGGKDAAGSGGKGNGKGGDGGDGGDGNDGAGTEGKGDERRWRRRLEEETALMAKVVSRMVKAWELMGKTGRAAVGKFKVDKKSQKTRLEQLEVTGQPKEPPRGAGAKAGKAGKGTDALLTTGPLAKKSGAKAAGAGPSSARAGTESAGGSTTKAASAGGAAGGAKKSAPGPASHVAKPKTKPTTKATTKKPMSRAASTTARAAGARAAAAANFAQLEIPALLLLAVVVALVQEQILGQHLTDNLKKMNCFPAEAVVTTVTGQKRMDQLAVGDFSLSCLMNAVTDVYFGVLVPKCWRCAENTNASRCSIIGSQRHEHSSVCYSPHQRSDLLSLRFTCFHFGECQSMRRDWKKADGGNGSSDFTHSPTKATVGECVLSVTNSGEVVAERIVKIGRQVSAGIYSPMTVDGALVVNGVLSSCFSQVESHTVQKIVFDFLTYAYEFFGLSPGRNTVRQGIPSFINYVHELSHVFLPFSKF